MQFRPPVSEASLNSSNPQKARVGYPVGTPPLPASAEVAKIKNWLEQDILDTNQRNCLVYDISVANERHLSIRRLMKDSISRPIRATVGSSLRKIFRHFEKFGSNL